MEDFIFHEGALPSGYVPDFEESLFNKEAHRSLQSRDGWQSFHTLDEKAKKVSASIHFHVSERLAKSPLRGSFGSVEFAASLPADVLSEFIRFFEQRLRSAGISSIVIKNYPECYTNAACLLQTFLINLGYRVSNAEIDYFLDVDSELLREKLHRSHKQRFDKALKENFIFRKLEVRELENVFNFIQQCQQAKGYQLSMDIRQMKTSAEKFPDDYKLFAVFKSDEMAAASIAIQVQRNILYDFYHAHLSTFDDVSPIVTLVAGLYGYCHRSNIGLLDLGTSAINGTPNFPLIHFKRCLGGKPAMKLTFEKILS